MPSIYLISPAADTPTYFAGEGFKGWGLPPTTFISDLATPTLAAYAQDFFDEVRLGEELIAPIDLDADVDVVGITGKVNQAGRMFALADAFRARGKTVVLGGPYASLSPEVVREHCDVLVRGEIEEIALDLFADLAAGRAKDEYVGTKPDMSGFRLPRWDLYPNDRSLMGAVQTSRSCPFECEFCDVIEYLGRGQRFKPIPDILRELDAIHAAGYRDVLLADDNFTVNRARARELLTAIRDWNARQTDGPLGFVIQASIDVTRDESLVALCADAGIHSAFIGIETPNEASLREVKKRQNLKIDLNAELDVFLRNGITVTGGMIVGFDADGPDIFDRIGTFVDEGNVPIYTIGALVAPAQTPLRRRLATAGRLVEAGSRVTGTPWDTNIVPALMSRPELFEGLRALCNRMYAPDAFRERMLRCIDVLGRTEGQVRSPGPGGVARPALRDAHRLTRRLSRKSEAHERLCLESLRAASKKPGAGEHVLGLLVRYAQLHYMYETCGVWYPDTVSA